MEVSYKLLLYSVRAGPIALAVDDEKLQSVTFMKFYECFTIPTFKL